MPQSKYLCEICTISELKLWARGQHLGITCFLTVLTWLIYKFYLSPTTQDITNEPVFLFSQTVQCLSSRLLFWSCDKPDFRFVFVYPYLSILVQRLVSVMMPIEAAKSSLWTVECWSSERGTEHPKVVRGTPRKGFLHTYIVDVA